MAVTGVVVVVAFMSLFLWQPIRILVERNLAWVGLSHRIFSTPVAVGGSPAQYTQYLDTYEARFAQLIRLEPDEPRAYLGLGISKALSRDTVSAQRIWQDGVVSPALVMPTIDWFQRRGEWDDVFLLYSVVHSMTTPIDPVVATRIAAACIQSEWHMGWTAESEHDGLCYDVLGDSPNLIVNGDFSSGNLLAWQRRHHANFQYAVEDGDGLFGSMARITGTERGEWGGIYQAVTLDPGRRGRLTASIKLEAVEGFTAYFVQVRGRAAGESWLQTRGAIRESADWSDYEFEFRIPSSNEGRVQFYPVFFTGKGTVWVDNVRLTLLDE